MALIHSFEKSGNMLFKYRGQIPVILFLLAIPVLHFTDYTFLTEKLILVYSIISVIISLSGFLIRAYAIGTTPKGTSGRNRDEQVAESLNTTGIYSVVRHPLYLGNYLMWIGIVVFSFNIYFIIIVSLLFWIYYERIMFAEERFLEKKFGDVYLDWSKRVHTFFPAFGKYIKSSFPFSFKSILRREYSGLAATAISFAFIDILRIYFITAQIVWQRVSVYVMVATILIAIILRTLKHCHMLDEEGRS
ncbi:MAG: isoprenylcysteine carboxylmethyltransferase family protein [Bacteroidota bacterium]